MEDLASLGFRVDSAGVRGATRDLDRLDKQSSKNEKSAASLSSAYRAVGGALASIGAAAFVREMVRVNSESQKLKASLKTVTGSIEGANAAWSELEEFARTTPFALTQSIQAFTKMKALGLDPTTEALTSFGNTASAMGKDLNQMIEAVADAATGEFERLKEFGIRAKQQGDEVTFIFQGVETTVQKSAANITEYLKGIGDVQFAGAMAEQMDTLGGQLSNLGDSTDAFFRSLGEAGGNQAASKSIQSVADAINALSDNADVLIDVSAAMAIAVGGKLAGGVATATGTMIAGQVQSARYQAALASMAGVSRVAAAAQLSMAAAVRTGSAAMALLGGPVGIALIAAGSLYYFRDSLFDTKQEATALQKELEGLTNNLIDLTTAQLQNRKSEITVKLTEMRQEATELAKALSRAEEKERMSNITSQGRTRAMGANTVAASELRRQYQKMTGNILFAEDSLAAVDRQLEAVGRSSERVGDSAESAADKIKKMDEAYASLLSKLDPAQAALNGYFETIEKIEGLDVSGREKDRLRQLAYEQHWKKMAEIAADGSEAAAEAFENPWQGTADRVAQSLQDAIASGDWESLGDVIGNTLATSIAGIINKEITDSLSRDLTSNSSQLAQIGAAFAGPIAGAVAGGAIQLALSELSDMFSGSDWDPTAARQAAQGTGSVLGSIDAKSESIANATDITANTNEQLVGINTGMLRSLQNLQIGIAGATAMIARGQGGSQFATSNRFSQTEKALQGSMIALGGIAPGSIGAIGGVSGAFGPLGGFLNDALGDVIGEAVGFLDNLTGGLLSDIGSSVFGGDQKIKDIGIELFGATLDEMIAGIREGDRLFTAQAFASIKEDGGWFGSDSRWDEYAKLSPEASQQISLVFAGIQDSITAGAEALGMSNDRIQSALDEFVVESQKISLEDMDAGEQAAALESVFSEIFDQAAGAVVPFIDQLQRAGEGLGETLARTATQVGLLEESIATLGSQWTTYFAPEHLAQAANNISQLLGGTEVFASAIAGVESNFMSEAEQLQSLSRRLGEAMGGLPLPETREGFLGLIRTQNLITEEGQENYATLLRLQGAADQYYSMLEDRSEEAAATAEQALEDARLSAEAFARSLGDSTDSAYEDLRRSVEGGIAIAREEYEMRMQANRMALSAAQEGLQAIQSEMQGIRGAAGQLRGSFDPIQQMRRSGALSSIRAALATGNLSGAGEAADIAANVSESGYETRVAFEREQAKTLGLLSLLEEEGQDQLTAAEQSIEALERQTDVIEREFNDEQRRLEGILQNGRDQIDAARGIETAVLGVSEAVAALTARLGVEMISPEEGFRNSGQRGTIESLYQSIGRDIASVTESEVEYWLATGLSGNELRNTFLESAAAYIGDPDYGSYAQRAASILSVPGFASGGTHTGGLRMVGERGPELEMTGPSRVMSHADLMQALGGSREMVSELKALRAENLAAQRKIEKNTRELKQIQERWNQQGLPETRNFA